MKFSGWHPLIALYWNVFVYYKFKSIFWTALDWYAISQKDATKC